MHFTAGKPIFLTSILSPVEMWQKYLSLPNTEGWASWQILNAAVSDSSELVLEDKTSIFEVA